jgi:hypothetical protein
VALAAISLIFFGGIDDQKSIELYLQKLQSLSVYCLDDLQKRHVIRYYLQNQNRCPHLSHRQKIRAEFNSRKRQLKQEWRIHYAQKWPTEAQRIRFKSNSKAVIDFQAHHIIPINAGGINYWWNISPMSDRNHQELHASLEEHACFAHDFLKQKAYRIMLKIREIFYDFMGKTDEFQRSIHTIAS